MSAAAPAAPAPAATPRDARSRPWWPLAALTLLAAVLRLSTLDLQSFWYDEAFTPVHVLHPSLWATLRSVVHTENTPPLWYLLAWADSRVSGPARSRCGCPPRSRGSPPCPSRGRSGASWPAAARRSCARRSSPSTRCSCGTRRRRARTGCSCSPPASRCSASCAPSGAHARADGGVRAGAASLALLTPLLRGVPARADGRCGWCRAARQAAPAASRRRRRWCRRAGAAAADLRAGRARHAVDRALAALRTPAGDPAVLPHRLLRRAARARGRAAGRAADPRRLVRLWRCWRVPHARARGAPAARGLPRR